MNGLRALLALFTLTAGAAGYVIASSRPSPCPTSVSIVTYGPDVAGQAVTVACYQHHWRIVGGNQTPGSEADIAH